MNHREEMYRCVACHGKLSVMHHDGLMCCQCGSVYPVVDSIPVLMPRAAAVLDVYVQELRAEKARLKGIEKDLAPVIGNKAHELAERAERMKRGMAQNIELMEKHCRSIVEHLRDDESTDDLLAWGAVQTGFPYREMLPYFYQDWYGTSDFEVVKSLFDRAVSEHCSDRGAVAVLGAGACGLLYALSDHFSVSFAVDLSLPVLLTAKHLIDGEPISIHLEHAEWKRINLSPPSHPDKEIRFVVANVMTLPFLDESLSVVVTQYLIDVVGNPIWLMAEIHRVLRPHGIWINFSTPVRIPDDPIVLGPRALSEVSALLERVGFDVIRSEMGRFKLINLEAICPGGDRDEDEVHFFVAKKVKNQRGTQRLEARGRFTKTDECLWERIPKLVTGRAVTLVNKKQFMQDGVIGQSEVGVMNQFVPIAAQHVNLLDRLFREIDGKRTLWDVWGVLRADGNPWNKEEFLELIRCLNVDHYLIELW